jgi:hypothetical protein
MEKWSYPPASNPGRWALVWIGLTLLVSPVFAAEVSATPKAPVPNSPYISVVYRFADTMLERGRDVHGPVSTGLFLSALDREFLRPLTNRPPAPTGIPEQIRIRGSTGALTGAQPQHDQNLLRLLYFLTEFTTKVKYRDAANGALTSYLHQASIVTPPRWSADVQWDTASDRLVVRNEEDARGADREFIRPWLLWDRCFEVAPEPSKRMALRLADGVASSAANPDPQTWRNAGFHLRTWAAGYAGTKDETFLRRMETQLNAIDALELDSVRRAADLVDPAFLSLSIDCAGAAHSVPEPLAGRLRERARRWEDAYCRARHEVEAAGGFLSAVAGGSTDISERRPTARWRAGWGEWTTAQVGMMCVSRYDNGAGLDARRLLFAAADAYLKSPPDPAEDLWPGTLGCAISLQIAAWRHSAQPKYLERARAFADFALEHFFGPHALPRASLRSSHYEAITGADTLVLALAELHLQVLHITAARCPANTLDR